MMPSAPVVTSNRNSVHVGLEHNALGVSAEVTKPHVAVENCDSNTASEQAGSNQAGPFAAKSRVLQLLCASVICKSCS